MANPDPPLFDQTRRELARLADELREMAAVRWELAGMEFRAALDQAKRLALLAALTAIAALTSLPLLALFAVEMLDGWWFSRAGWLLVFGLGLLAAAAIGGWLSLRRFRRFAAMEETLEEIREDLVWLEEWRGDGGKRVDG